MNFERVPQKAIDTVRMLSADGVEKAKSGHPGTPMGAAEYTLSFWANQLRFNPAEPAWRDRDRFILSAGHASMLLYSLLHLFGYDLPLEELKNFRQLHSKTAGHPEYGDAPGIEVTTGPLGQGISNAVGFALGSAMLAARYNTADFSPVRSTTWVLAGDGCLMEGVSSEACSLAGHLKLPNLIALYDSNHITIEGGTNLAFTEDVAKRYEAYGWQVLRADAYDQENFQAALAQAKPAEGPVLVIVTSTIGKGAATLEGSHKTHGEPLGGEELKKTKEKLGWPLEPAFYVPEDAKTWFASVAQKKKAAYQAWTQGFEAWQKKNPDLAKQWEQQWSQETPADLDAKMAEGMEAMVAATRAHSGKALNRAAAVLPWFVGGSADLQPSNASAIDGGGDVGLVKEGLSMHASYKNRVLHFGVREHGMGAILNGMNLHGAWRVFGATFLQFADYMRPSIRLAALMKAKSIFLFTHDSIFLGEDGPTHQPVEHFAALRVIPGLHFWRPADGLESAMAWAWTLMKAQGPVALAFSRQKVAQLPFVPGFDRRNVWKGGYVLQEASSADLTFVSTGSEVGPTLAAAKLLADKGIQSRVVSMPCTSLFEAQGEAYRESVLGKKPLCVVEAGVSGLWKGLVGPSGLVLGVDRFGASAPADKLAEAYGFTPAQIASRVEAWIRKQDKVLS
jgi:transketolase